MGFVSANQVTIGYTAASREDALHYLSEQAIELGFADDASAVEAAFIARENEAETGLVAGFAVPSPRKRAATPYRCRGPVCVSPDKTCQNKPVPFWQANRELFHRNLGHG